MGLGLGLSLGLCLGLGLGLGLGLTWIGGLVECLCLNWPGLAWFGLVKSLCLFKFFFYLAITVS